MATFYKPAKHKQAPRQSSKTSVLEVAGFNHEGQGVARQQGKVVFIQGALPGERVEARVEAEQKRYSRARATNILSPSTQRQVAPCPHYQRCGGCQMQHASYALQLNAKQQRLRQLLLKEAGVELTQLAAPLTDQPYGYRRRARLAFKPTRDGQHLLGFRAQRDNTVIPIKTCPVLTPALQQLPAVLAEALRRIRHPQRIGHVELLDIDQGVVVLIRVAEALCDADQQLLAEVCTDANLRLLFEANQGLVDTTSSFSYTLALPTGALQVGFNPSEFIQVNASLNGQMVAQALQWLNPGPQDKVLDLFCGVGNFSLALAQTGAEVVGVEGVATMVEQARHNAAHNQLSRCRFIQADLEQPVANWLGDEAGFTQLLLDPSRAGAKVVAEQIEALGVRQILYVSCDPATLCRDIGLMVAAGYVVERACLIDMFPQTHHMESMVLLTRTHASNS